MGAFVLAKTISELELAYSQLRKDLPGYDGEFWESIYLDRRYELGSGGNDIDLHHLAEANPGWVVPFILLIRRKKANHDLQAAERMLELATRNLRSNHLDWAIREGVKLYYTMNGSRRALEYCIRWIRSDISNGAKGEMISTLADEMKSDGKIDGFRMAIEVAITLDPSLSHRRFNLAYSYGETQSRWPATLEHYRQLRYDDDQGAMSWNNLGVLLADFDKAAGIDALDHSVAKDNPMAKANLAKDLIEDGYLSAAERLLENLEEKGEVAENIASAKLKYAAGRRKLEKTLEEIYSIGTKQYTLFKSSALQSYRHVQEDSSPIIGRFVSDDGNAEVSIEADGVKCQILIAGTLFKGTLTDQLLCYAGTVSWQGAGVFDTRSREILALSASNALLRLVIWPSSVALDSKIEIIDLERAQSESVSKGWITREGEQFCGS